MYPLLNCDAIDGVVAALILVEPNHLMNIIALSMAM